MLGDDVEDAVRLDRGARCPDHGARGTTRTGSRRTPVRRPTTTPTTCSCARSSASTGSVEVELVCEPAFDYGRDARRRGRCRTAAGTPPTRPAPGVTIRLRSDLALGIEGNRVRGAARPRAGRAGVLRALLGRGAAGRRPTSTTAEAQMAATDALLARLARRRPHPRPPLPRSDPALGADHQGPDLHADRRHRGRAHHVAAGDAGRRAQLGLPLHLDARLDLHAAGAPLPQPRLGGRRVHAVRRRRRADRGRVAADHVRHRRPAGADRDRPATTSPATRARARCASATAPSTSARTTSSAPCSTRSCSTRRARQRLPRRLWPIVEAQAECATRVWREPDQGIWEARGEPQHYVSSKLMCWVALDRAAKLAEIRGDPELRREVARHGGRDPRRHPRARRERARRAAPALRDRRARRLDAAGRASSGSCPADDERLRATRAGDRRRAHRGRLRAALPHRRDRRRPVRQGGHVPHLLVLARVGAGRSSASSSGPAT